MSSKPTAAKAAKISVLRAEADAHDDVATVALCDAALAGDATALATISVQMRSTAKRSAEKPARARRSAWAGPPVAASSFDEQDI